MKKVLYIHQYFKTPADGGAIRSYYLAKGMLKRNIQVDMITCHNNTPFKNEIIDGINVHYLPVKYSNDFSYLRRVFAFLQFVFTAIIYCRKINNSNLIYATSTPLTVGIIALWMKWTKNIPYIFEVRDLWPEAPIQFGLIKSIILKSALKKLEKFIYRNSSSIVALSPGIKAGILHRYKNAKVHVIPNMADIDYFQSKPILSYNKKHFSIGYFGAFGFANNIEFILDLASQCQKVNLPISFYLVGDGSKKEEINYRISNQGLKNVLSFKNKSKPEIREMMNEVEACLTSFLNFPILETNSPNKFYDGLAAGKLTIVNTKGWLKELVEENKCGFYIDPLKPETFPTLIKPFLDDRNLLLNCQQRALQLAEDKFEKNKLVDKVCDLILSVIPDN